MLKIGFLTFEQHQKKTNIGSTRIRVRRVLDNWLKYKPEHSEAELYKMGEKYDVIVYQKAYFKEHVKVFKGVKILDMCDADWLHWSYPIKETIVECDAITTSTEALARAVSDFAGEKIVAAIPDRVDLAVQTPRKVHAGDLKTVVWYGYAENFPALSPCVPTLAKMGLKLIVVSTGVFAAPAGIKEDFEIVNYPWNANTFEDDILRADVVLNPKLKGGRFKFKSNNKTIDAWAMGMPVAETDKDLIRLKTADSRIAEVDKRRLELAESYDIVQSVKEYKDLIDMILESKKV